MKELIPRKELRKGRVKNNETLLNKEPNIYSFENGYFTIFFQ